MPKKNWRPNSFDDRKMPENNLSKEREQEVDRKMEKLLPEALIKLEKEAIRLQKEETK